MFAQENMLSSSKRVLSFITTGVIALAPMLALGAQGSFTGTYFTDIVATISTIVNTLIPIIIGLAFIFFAWSLISYIRSSGDDKVKNKSQLIWSVIAIVLIVSIWGIANLLQGIFGATGTSSSIDALNISTL